MGEATGVAGCEGVFVWLGLGGKQVFHLGEVARHMGRPAIDGQKAGQDAGAFLGGTEPGRGAEQQDGDEDSTYPAPGILVLV